MVDRKMIRILLVLAFVKIHGALPPEEFDDVELRGEVEDINSTREILIKLGAESLGLYDFKDFIYSSSDKFIDDDYWRIRHYKVNNWKISNVNLTHKIAPSKGTKPQKVFFEEMSSLDEAKSRLPYDISLQFSFSRRGEQFRFESFDIFLEKIENLPPSIEIVAKESKQKVTEFMMSLGTKKIISKSVAQQILENKSLKSVA